MKSVRWRHFFTSLVVLLTIFFLNAHGILKDWDYWFFQTEHFISGFFLVMFLFSFSISKAYILIALGILGILWECFEYAVVYSPTLPDFIAHFLQIDAPSLTWQDTIFDVILDFSGGFLFILLNKKLKKEAK